MPTLQLGVALGHGWIEGLQEEEDDTICNLGASSKCKGE